MNDEEFYSKIRKSLFDAGIDLMSSKVLTDLVKLLMMSDIGGKSFVDTRSLMAYASMKLTERLIYDMKTSNQDVDDFLRTGNLPDYMQDVPPQFKQAMEEAARKLRESRGL